MKSANKSLVVAFLATTTLLALQSTAHAWNFFIVTGPGGAPIAQVAQQIVPSAFNGAPGLGLDYIYRVKNIGALPIDGFSIFTGPAGPAMPLTYTGIPPATNPGFLQPFGPLGNASVPFLTGEGNTFSPVAWRFDEYDNRATGPVTRYVTHWVSPIAAPLPPGFWTEFDLFSTNPPVLGGGAVDIDGPGAIGIDVEGMTPDPGNSSFFAMLTYNQQVSISDNPDTSDPFPGSTQLGPGTPLPEPSSMAMLVIGVSIAGLARYRRRTS